MGNETDPVNELTLEILYTNKFDCRANSAGAMSKKLLCKMQPGDAARIGACKTPGPEVMI